MIQVPNAVLYTLGVVIYLALREALPIIYRRVKKSKKHVQDQLDEMKKSVHQLVITALGVGDDQNTTPQNDQADGEGGESQPNDSDTTLAL